MDINKLIAEQLNLNVDNVTTSIEMMDSGDTVPFIARYRKEKTGGLTDENLRAIEEKLIAFRNLEDRKKTIFKSLAEQNITDETLLKNIEDSLSMSEIEDLYRPYKPKRVTRASKAIKAGLKPLAEYLKSDKTGLLNQEAEKYICEEYNTVEKCIAGAFDILAEEISDNANYRTFIKNYAWKKGILSSTKIADTDDKYDNYANYERNISSLKSYNILAINRGVNKKVLSKKFIFDDEMIIAHISMFEIPSKTPYIEQFKEMITDSYNRLIYPSVCNDIFSELMDTASDTAIEEFKISLKATLLFPPLKNKRILGFDPGFTHGCKLAFIDESGKVLDTYVLKDPFHNQGNRAIAFSILPKLIEKNKTYTVALGNGTASRESQELLEEIKEKYIPNLMISVVSESGASIWSATKDAQDEFPQFEPNLRSAVSIARRLQDPLAELVKIPPESIGVGQYQYDIDGKKLSLALKGVVEDCVNSIGVNLNTASSALLSYISGISSKTAQAIVKYRDENGVFKSRQELLSVTGVGKKAFENCAGFLRITDGVEPLDNTAVHPESYEIAKKLLKNVGLTSLSNNDERKEKLSKLTEDDVLKLAKELNAGVPTLIDIIKELIQPSRDPREENKTANLTKGVIDIKDLKIGSIMEGTIRNVAEFGFFVDIGVEINGLVYISEISSNFVKDPHQYGKPGDIVKVKVIGVDLQRKRISLSMKI